MGVVRFVKVVGGCGVPCAVERDALRCRVLITTCTRLLTKELLKITPMHMMNREIIPGRNKRVRLCPV